MKPEVGQTWIDRLDREAYLEQIGMTGQIIVFRYSPREARVIVPIELLHSNWTLKP